MAGNSTPDKIKVVATNRKARHNYSVVDSFEAGLALVGSEVKSLREGRMDLKDSYGSLRSSELFLVGAYIGPYGFARDGGHEPERERKMLLHRREIDRIAGQLAEKGLTLVPLQVYFKNGRVKVELALARGKSTIDKRQTLRERDHDREMERAMSRVRRRS
jgi:SsrA-binding protein